MTKPTRTYAERMALKDEKIQELMRERKELRQKHNAAERKARNRRLYRRHGLLEKFMPDLITLSDDQFELFIKTGINTKYGRQRLAEIIAEGFETTPSTHAETNNTSELSGGVNPP